MKSKNQLKICIQENKLPFLICKFVNSDPSSKTKFSRVVLLEPVITVPVMIFIGTNGPLVNISIYARLDA